MLNRYFRLSFTDETVIYSPDSKNGKAYLLDACDVLIFDGKLVHEGLCVKEGTKNNFQYQS